MTKSLTIHLVFLGIFIPLSLFSQKADHQPKNPELLWKLIHSENSDSLALFLKHEDTDLLSSISALATSYGADSVSKSLTDALSDLNNVAPSQTRAAAEVLISYTSQRGDTLYLAKSYLLLANAVSELGENQQALEYCLMALNYADKVNDDELKLNVLNSIGYMHHITGDYKNSAMYYRKYIMEAQARVNPEKVAIGYLNIGNTFSADNQEDSARYFYENSLVLAKELNLKTVEAYALGNLAYLFVQTGDIRKGIEYQTAGLKIEEATNDNIAMIDSHNVLATCYAKLGDSKQATDHYRQAMEIARAINARFKMLDLLYEGQQVYADLGNFAEAYAISRQYQHLNDSLLNAQRNAQFAELREKYETSQKEARISNLEEEQRVSDLEIEKRRNENIILVVTIVLLVVIVAFISVFFAQARKRKKETEVRNETITKINKALNKSQNDLIASNKTKDKFFALVAHDLRGPITSLQGIGRMLFYYNKKGDENRINQLISQVDQSAQSVNHLLDNLLKWALSQTNGLVFQPSVFDLSRLVEECAVIFEENLTAKQIELDISIEGGTFVEADYNMISTVLRNLLSNAIKFSPSGSTVSLAAFAQQEHLEISVSDSGAGMPEKTLKDILNDQPVSSSLGTHDEKGTGLGLTLCREFVMKHGSELNISTSPRGTAISFSLKMVEQVANA